jgi:fermentation-respiration switch protein FrsA (DUF1100 family)
MFTMQRSLIYPAAIEAPDLARHGLPLLREVHTRPEPEIRLAHWYHPPAGDEQPVIVYFHGNAGNRGDRVPKMRPFIEAGFGVLFTGYRGYGGNPGRPSEAGLTADGRSAYNWIIDQGFTHERIVIFGESLGTAVAAKVAADYPPAALVLEAPPSSIAEVAQSHYWYLPVRLLIRDPWNTLSRIGAITAPKLFLHGEQDRVVPIRFGRKLYEAAAEPKQALWHPSARHTDILDDPDVVRCVIEFIRTR